MRTILGECGIRLRVRRIRPGNPGLLPNGEITRQVQWHVGEQGAEMEREAKRGGKMAKARGSEKREEIREVRSGVDERPETFGSSVILPRYNGKRRRAMNSISSLLLAARARAHAFVKIHVR